MQYRKFGKTNEVVSVLGFGCMRLAILPGGDTTKIDEQKATEQLRYAIDHGVNYVDTAYPYHGKNMDTAGESEPFLARALKDGYRNKVKLATKLPTWLIKSRSDMDKYLNEQLARLETDSIDFYLVHTLNTNSWSNVKEAGITEFLDQALKDGRIKHAGFSFHDKYECFKEIVDAYDWSFCQIQYNYLDENYQAGLAGLQYAAQKGLGITIMEPLRGGKLAVALPEEVQSVFEKAESKRTPAQWGLSWVWNHPEVSTVLSGMNTMQQVQENLQAAQVSAPNAMSKDELEVIDKVKTIFQTRIKVNCTACGYCMPCPSGVNIPVCFSMYNNYFVFGKETMYNRILQAPQRASACMECGECETQCPQGIEIRDELKKVKGIFEQDK